MLLCHLMFCLDLHEIKWIKNEANYKFYLNQHNFHDKKKFYLGIVAFEIKDLWVESKLSVYIGTM